MSISDNEAVNAQQTQQQSRLLRNGVAHEIYAFARNVAGADQSVLRERLFALKTAGADPMDCYTRLDREIRRGA